VARQEEDLSVQLVAQPATAYLASDDVVDWRHPAVRDLSAALCRGTLTQSDAASRAFHFVRDQVSHSWDVQDRRVTVSASDVLREGVGLCYGKSHLLAALLRAQGIPTGLCYQRLRDDAGSFSLHGLVAVLIEDRWHRLDPRGNKPGVDAQFRLDVEQLAWPVRAELGEVDYPEVYPEPATVVVEALCGARDMLLLCETGLPQALLGEA
jgi:transglutaminase-like putative cysteine protease